MIAGLGAGNVAGIVVGIGAGIARGSVDDIVAELDLGDAGVRYGLDNPRMVARALTYHRH